VTRPSFSGVFIWDLTMRRLLFALFSVLAVPAAATAASPIGSTNMSFDPGHGTQVEYLAANGGAHLWYPGNSIILHGQWKRQGASLCFKYGPNSYNPVTHVYGDKWECESSSLYTSVLAEQAKGDVFRLAGRSAVPFPLPHNRVTLEQLAQKVGLGVELGEVHTAKPPEKPAPLTQAAAASTCAAAIANAHASRQAMISAAITYYHGEYMGQHCLQVDYGKAFELLKQAGDTADYGSLLGDLKLKAASGNPKAAAALQKLGVPN
jgi:hypothetical protein